MNKKGDSLFILLQFLIFFCLIMAFLALSDNKEDVNDFCRDNGFKTSDIALWRFEKSYCTKIVNNNIIKAEIERRDDTWHFIEYKRESTQPTQTQHIILNKLIDNNNG